MHPRALPIAPASSHAPPSQPLDDTPNSQQPQNQAPKPQFAHAGPHKRGKIGSKMREKDIGFRAFLPPPPPTLRAAVRPPRVDWDPGLFRASIFTHNLQPIQFVCVENGCALQTKKMISIFFYFRPSGPKRR